MFIHSSFVTTLSWSGPWQIWSPSQEKWEYTLAGISPLYTFIHSFSPRHNLFRPTHLLPCFWEVGKKKKSENTWETYKDTGPNGKLQTDSNPCSGPNWGLWSCEVAILFAVPPFWNIFLCYKLRDMASLIMSFNYTGAREYLENRF